MDNHQGYICWQEFLNNQQKLDDNRTWQAQQRRGAVREGVALLQGIILCGRCGRRMGVRYNKDGLTPFYECKKAHIHLAEPICQTMRGDIIDKAVVNCFLAAVEPAQLEISLAVLEEIDKQSRQIEHQWKLRKERLEYEVLLARRRYLAVEPENRLVARSLERDWNEKLAALESLEREYLTLPIHKSKTLSTEQRKQILQLAQDLPTLWNSKTTSNVERKQLIRFLITDVTVIRYEKTIDVNIRWQTGASTKLEVDRLKKSWEIRKTDSKIVSLISQLAIDNTDQQIAEKLNTVGLKTSLGEAFTGRKVRWIRYANSIITGCPERPAYSSNGQRADSRYSTQATAKILNVQVCTITKWCRTGILDGIRAKEQSPYWIKLTPEIISKLRKPHIRHHTRQTF